MRLALPVLLATLSLTACGGGATANELGDGPQALINLSVEVGPQGDDTLDVVRSTFQTDKNGATWYDALADAQDDPAMGFTVASARVLDGWSWWSVDDSVGLGPLDLFRGVARPDQAVRSYVQRDTSGMLVRILNLLRPGHFSRLSERVTLLDGRGALLVEVSDSIGTVRFQPLRSDTREASAFEIRDVDNVLVFARTNQIVRDTSVVPEGPIWTAVFAEGGSVPSTAARSEKPTAGRDVSLRVGELEFATPGRVVVATGPTAELAVAKARSSLAAADEIREARRNRMVDVLAATPFDTEDEAYDTAFRWSLLSFDALIRQDSSRATLVPGLPGAEPATIPSSMWTFGAMLASGRWDLARDFLTTMGAAQRFDRRIDVLGAAPDLVRADGPPVFANADATPLFVKAAGDYVRTTGDQGLVRGGPNFWYKINFALRGLYESDSRNGNSTDSLGFLRTRPGRGTWLDATALDEAGPRQGALVEGQAALAKALGSAHAFARIMGVSQRTGTNWYADTARVLISDLERRFVRDSVLADRLPSGGEDAATVGPNGLLALSMLGSIPSARRAALARTLALQLVYKHGVSSLAQTDSSFHPYVATAVPGASLRTRGAIWTWLTGPVAILMAETGGGGPAGELMAAEADVVVNRGVIGALPELMATHTRPNADAPEIGGAPVQPWSLAGFIDATMTGLVGASYPSADTLLLEPRLPESWGVTTTRFRLGGGTVSLRMEPLGGGLRLEIRPSGSMSASSALRVRASGVDVTIPLGASPDTLIQAVLTDGSATVNDETVSVSRKTARATGWDGFEFVTPNPDLGGESTANESGAQVLQRDRVTRTNPRAKSVLTRTDPQGDDWGSTGTFTYPSGYPAGVLDATYLEVSADDSTTYFRAEFGALASSDVLGFPPTFVAFMLDTDSEGGASDVARNANYELGDDGYEYVIYVGDGLQIEDERGRILATVPPGGESMWDTETATLALSIPTTALPPLPPRTRVTLLIGALDPDGVGSFRSVTRQPTPDTGGGKVDSRAPHVYDVVAGTTR